MKRRDLFKLGAGAAAAAIVPAVAAVVPKALPKDDPQTYRHLDVLPDGSIRTRNGSVLGPYGSYIWYDNRTKKFSIYRPTAPCLTAVYDPDTDTWTEIT